MVLNVKILDVPGFDARAAAFDEADTTLISRDIVSILIGTARTIVSQGLFLSHITDEGPRSILQLLPERLLISSWAM